MERRRRKPGCGAIGAILAQPTGGGNGRNKTVLDDRDQQPEALPARSPEALARVRASSADEHNRLDHSAMPRVGSFGSDASWNSSARFSRWCGDRIPAAVSNHNRIPSCRILSSCQNPSVSLRSPGLPNRGSLRQSAGRSPKPPSSSAPPSPRRTLHRTLCRILPTPSILSFLPLPS